MYVGNQLKIIKSFKVKVVPTIWRVYNKIIMLSGRSEDTQYN